MRIQDRPIDERPYEKLELKGAKSLSDIELLAILLKSGTKEYNVKELAEQVLTYYCPKENLVSKGVSSKKTSFISLYQFSYEELKQIKGVGKVKALQILALLEISRRIALEKNFPQQKVSSPRLLSNYFMEMLRHQKEEHFVVAFLDAKCRLLGHSLVSKGSLTASIVHPREVYKLAVQKSAHSIVVLHNHPSGDPRPSQEDLQITTRLKQAGEIMGIPLLDHIIIGDGNYISLKEESYF